LSSISKEIDRLASDLPGNASVGNIFPAINISLESQHETMPSGEEDEDEPFGGYDPIGSFVTQKPSSDEDFFGQLR
jgi:hypothetical protein